MYLPEKDVVGRFQRLASNFSDSQIVFEVGAKRYSAGYRKKLVESKFRRTYGVQAGGSYQYGIDNAKVIESYASNLQIINVWFFLDDPNQKPIF